MNGESTADKYSRLCLGGSVGVEHSCGMDAERLISAVHSAVAFWDAFDPMHSDRLYISAKWIEIATYLGVSGMLLSNII